MNFDYAPSFTLLNQYGKSISLEDFRGQWVIVYFYPKDDTPGCTQEACEFSSAEEFFQTNSVKVIGISPDSVASHATFYGKHVLKIELLSDPEKVVLRKYGAWGLKKNYGKEYEGVIRSTFIINPEGRIVAKWVSVKVKGHVEKVRERLGNLLSTC